MIFQGHADTHKGKVWFQRVEVQSSQHRHWGGGGREEVFPQTVGITTVYIFERSGSLVQSDSDREPWDTNRCCSPRFLPYMGRPGLDAGPGYKTSHHPSYLPDSLCLLAHPPPGVLPESDRPIKAFINGP